MKTLRLEVVQEETIWEAALKRVGGGTEGAGGEGCVYAAFKYKCTENRWAAGRAAQKLRGGTAETWLRMGKACAGRRHRAAGWGLPVLRSAWPRRLAVLLEAAEDFGGSSVPLRCFLWVPSELTGVSDGDLKRLRGDCRERRQQSVRYCSLRCWCWVPLTWKLLCLHDTKY